MVAQEWSIDGPRVLDIGDEHEQVTSLQVGVVAGRVDVVTHDDSPTARVEVTQVEGLPVRVRWDDGTLRVIHGKDDDANILDMLKRTFETFGRNRAVISISVPVATRASVSTVSAAAVVSGVHGKGHRQHGVRCGHHQRRRRRHRPQHGQRDGRRRRPRRPHHGQHRLRQRHPAGQPAAVGRRQHGQRRHRHGPHVGRGHHPVQLGVGRRHGAGPPHRVRHRRTHGDGPGHRRRPHPSQGGAQRVRRPRQGGRLFDGDGSLKVKASAVSGSIVVLRSTATGTVPSTPQDQPPSAGGPPQDRPPQDPPPTSPSPQDSPPEAYRPVDGTDR